MASSVKPPASNVINVKGHMVTKSSALSTGNSKLESQFLTAQNMASHYKRVINAKSAINTLPPKSLTCSQKARDRAKREMKNYSIAQKSFERSKSAENSARLDNDISVSESLSQFDSQKKSSATTTSNQQGYQPKITKSVYRDVINRNIVVQEIAESKPLPNQQKLNKSMLNLTAGFTKPKSGRVQVFSPSPRASFSATEPQNMFSKKFDFMGTKNKNVMANFLYNSTNKDVKSSTSDFQMSNTACKAMSKLVAGKQYDVLDNHAKKFSHPTKTFQPRIKNTNSASAMVTTKSSYYQPPRRRKPKQGLRGSVQNSVTSLRETQNEKSIISDHLNKSSHENILSDEDLNSDIENGLNNSKGRFNNSKSNKNTNFKSSSRKSSIDIVTQQKAEQEKENELKYLEFIKEVTNDVIARGISSNRVINSCFDYHVSKNKHILDEQKMNDLLETLKKDIGITYGDQKENSSNDKYQTLNQLGYSNLSSPVPRHRRGSRGSTHSLNNSKLSEHSLNNIKNTEKNDVFENYENQIVKNIQSIRRNSISSGNLSAEKIEEQNDKENNNPLNGSRISRKSSASRKSSTESGGSAKSQPQSSILKNTNNFSPDLNVTRQKTKIEYGDSDDDSDIRANNSNIRKTSNGSIRSQNNNNKSGSQQMGATIKPSSSNLGSEENLFNDNYSGSENSSEGELKSKKDKDSDDDDDEDDFDSMLKTKSFSNSRKKLENAMTKNNFDDGSNENLSVREQARSTTPRPVPRKTNIPYKHETISGSSDDEY